MTTWTALRTAWTTRSKLLRTHCGLNQSTDRLTCAFRRAERVDLVDAHKHAVAGVVVGEAGAVGGGAYRPALRRVGLVVDGDGRPGPQVAQHPLHRPASVDADAVGVFTVLQRRVGERRLAAHAVLVDLAARQAGLGFDEHITVLVGRQRDG